MESPPGQLHEGARGEVIRPDDGQSKQALFESWNSFRFSTSFSKMISYY